MERRIGAAQHPEARETIATFFWAGLPVISLARYATVLQGRDTRLTFAASVLGRLPIGITGLAILLLVQSSSGSFAAGGAATACYVIGLAAASPALGRWIDRRGPGAVLAVCGLLFPAALVALVAAVSHGAASWLTLLLSGAAGASFPPITVCMRTYFRQRLRDDALLAAAFSLESVLIEVMFIAGPMLVALLVALASPAAAVWFAAACGGVGSLAFRRSPALYAWHIERRVAGRNLLGPLADASFVAFVAVVLCYSTAFGLVEIGITAYATEAGSPALAGVFLALMSTGSAFGGLAYGSRSWHIPLSRQFSLMLAAMGLGLAVLALPLGQWWFALCSVLAGVVMAPALIIQSMLVVKIARPHHSTEAFTWSTSALLGGIGIGLAAGGGLLEIWPSTAPMAAAAVVAFAAAAAAGLALVPR